MIRGRRVVLLAGSTLLSVALAVAVNVATGGSLPGPIDGLQWLAWPLVAALAAAVAAIAVWESGSDDPTGAGGGGADGRTIRPAELPPGALRFAGRQDDFDALLAAVPARPVAGLGSPVVLGVFGAGGMGKTVLATRVAHAVAARYPDGQVFVELRGASAEPAVAGEVLRRVLQAFGVAAADIPEDLGARQALYRSVLADRRVLIYLDDAGDEAQVRALMPAATGCLVLVTARPSLYGIGLTAWRDLDALSEPAALALVQAISGDTDRFDAEPEATAEVLRLCGYLPLALGIAAARLRTRPRWTVADLASRLSDERRRLDELHIGNQDVRASIRVSYADLDPVAGRLFRLLSVIGHTSLGPGVAGALLGGFEHWQAAEVALERLADMKLVEVTGARRYVLHDLVRIFAREQLEAEEPPESRREALLRALRYYLERTEAQWRDLADPSADEARRSDAEGWFARSRPAIVAAVRRALDAGEPALAGQIAAAAAPYLESRAYFVDLAALSETAVEAARATGDEVALATALQSLGQSAGHRSLHDEALAAFTESLELWQMLGQHGPAAEMLHHLGDALGEARRLDEAEDAYTRSIAAFEALGRERDVALVESSLAHTWLLGGRLDQASALIEAAADQLGVNDPGAEPDQAGSWVLETLGVTRLAAGSPASAAECHHRSLASFRSRGERQGSACALLNLGRCAVALGDGGASRQHLTESLRLFTEMGNLGGQADAEEALAALPEDGEPGRRPLSSLFGGRAAK